MHIYVKNTLKVLGAFTIVLIAGAIIANQDSHEEETNGYQETRSTLSDAAKLLLDEKECLKRNWGACTNAGVAYSNGNGVEQNYTKAFARFTKACDHGDDTGCYDLGIVYENGEGIVKDEAKAVELYKKSCDLGEASGCSAYGMKLLDRANDVADAETALDLIRRACDDKNAQSCVRLGILYSHGMAFVDADAPRAFKYFSQACELGYADGCYFKANAYEEGNGVRASIPIAFNIYAENCEKRLDGSSCYSAGVMLQGYTDEIPENREQALKYFNIGCEKGSDDSSCEEVKLLRAQFDSKHPEQ
ncbi:MAG: tetratricopeptide repeat protein [Sulfuricurvum sp.]